MHIISAKYAYNNKLRKFIFILINNKYLFDILMNIT